MIGLLVIKVISDPIEVMNHVNISVAALRRSASDPEVEVNNDGRYIVKKISMSLLLSIIDPLRSGTNGSVWAK